MPSSRSVAALAASLAFLVPLAATAHKPSYSDGGHSAPELAFPIADPDLSIVLYHRVGCDAQQLWLSFETTEPRELFVQLGIPVIDRLLEYRPTLAVLAPGLPTPPDGLPFEVPAGLGALVFDTGSVTEPAPFDEPFTQTSSRILHESRVRLPEAGAGYVVAFHPQRMSGKLWVAVGEREEFGAADFADADEWIEKTQRFHETGSYAPATPPEEVLCAATEPHADDGHAHGDEAAAADGDSHQEGTAGCSAAAGAPLPLLALLALLAAPKRRRTTRHS